MEVVTYLSTKEAAQSLGIHPQTLRSWERDGVIPAVSRRRGRRVYTAADIDAIKACVFDTPEEGQ